MTLVVPVCSKDLTSFFPERSLGRFAVRYRGASLMRNRHPVATVGPCVGRVRLDDQVNSAWPPPAVDQIEDVTRAISFERPAVLPHGTIDVQVDLTYEKMHPPRTLPQKDLTDLKDSR